MSIILFRSKQFASKIYNAIFMYYFLCKLLTDLHNSIHFITGLNHMHKSSVRSVRQKFLVRSFPNIVYTVRCPLYTHGMGIMYIGRCTVHISKHTHTWYGYNFSKVSSINFLICYNFTGNLILEYKYCKKF